MTGIVWEEPPPPKPGPKPRHEAIAAELRSNPGKWAKVAVASPGMASTIKSGRMIAYQPQGAFEAVARNYRSADGHVRGVADIYARYIGERIGEAS